MFTTVQTWLTIAEQDPACVVAVLQLDEENPTTELGDNGADARVALQAILIVARDLSKKKPRYAKLWENLIMAGIADALCESIAKPDRLANNTGSGRDRSRIQWWSTTTTTAQNTTDPPLALANDSTEAPSQPPATPWAHALHTLAFGVAAIKQPPTLTDKIVIDALKKHWSGMVTRLWNDPAHSLDETPQTVRVNERAWIAEILTKLIVVDPSIMADCVYLPDDLTISLIARQWQHSTSTRDASLTADALTQSIMFPLVPSLSEEQMAAHSPSPKRQTLERILSVFQPASGPDDEIACAALLDVAVKHMTRDAPANSRHFTFELILFLHYSTVMATPSIDTFHAALRTHSTFWRTFFDFYTKAGEQEIVFLMELLQEFLWNISSHFGFEETKTAELRELLHIWVREGYFEAVEASMAFTLTELADGPLKYHIVLKSMIDAVSSPDAADLRAEMATHFPRARTIAAMCEKAADDVNKRDPEHPTAEKKVLNWLMKPYDNDKHGLVRSLWQMQAELQSICKGRDLCNLRGCSNSASAKCGKCRAVSYCSQTCQINDWKEHKRVCAPRWEALCNQYMDQTRDEKLLTAARDMNLEGPEEPVPQIELFMSGSEWATRT
ncbi:unnamed protein product [Peniophora sp. CBMAI 1063]|nr:unnamed protein product [Peniophora sp. CBMAI 1063]